MGAQNATSLAIAALALLWLGLAVAIAITAARRFSLAQRVLDTARANARLLEVTPARPLVVRADGRIEADERLVRELGLEAPPANFDGLTRDGGGIIAEDLEELRATIEAARASATPVVCRVRTNGGGRTFDVRGGAAPPGEPPGTLLLWFVDVSATEEERAKLASRLRQTEAAVNSLTQVIEAAPFPMWYRGPDLKLGLVNSAFVHAVEGRDASEVIERCAELIDAEGDDSPLARAREAQSGGRTVSRMISAASCSLPSRSSSSREVLCARIIRIALRIAGM